MTPAPSRSVAAACAMSLLLAACKAGPNYHNPGVGMIPATFKAAPGWQPAAPADDKPRGDWWAIFNDPALNDLEARVARANQNVAASLAA